MPALNLDLHAQQGKAFLSPATEILYGGAAGGGKSHLMRVAAITWCAEIPGLQVYLFRRISEDLVKNHIEGPKGLRSLLAPWENEGLARIVEDEIRFWNGSKIYLCHCKDEKDRFKYLGAEIHVLLIDELTTFSDVIYRFLRGRVRAVGLNLPEKYRNCFPRILAGSNPGNLGHHWVKAGFIDNARAYDVRPMPDGEGGMLRQFIPAKLEDNPSMAEDDPKYRARLRGLGSPALVKAMEDGDWNVVVGSYFPEFSTEKHVIEPFELPDYWPRIRGMDWGSARPFAVYWAAVSDGTLRVAPRGALVVYREWYGWNGQPNEGMRLPAQEIGREIRRLESLEKINDEVLDPAAFATDGGPSIAERLDLNFRRADNARVARNGAMGGWDQVRERLRGQDNQPLLYIFSTCVHLIRTLPALQHDDLRPEDVDTDSEDHAADTLRYICMSRPITRDKPKDQPRRFETDLSFNDLVKRAREKRRAEE